MLYPLSKDTVWQTGLKRKSQQPVVYKKPTILTETNTVKRLRVKGKMVEEDLPS
jgi:hypothetical protein